MAESHVFSTGILRIGAPGNTALGTPDLIGEAQDVSFDTTFNRKELFAAASVGVFAVDNADHEGKCTLKATVKDINRKLIPYLTGAVHTTVSTQDVYTIGALSVPQYARVEFAGIDTNGKNVLIVGTRVKAKGMNMAAKLTDFADLPLEFDFYPDPLTTVANTVATTTIDQ